MLLAWVERSADGNPSPNNFNSIILAEAIQEAIGFLQRYLILPSSEHYYVLACWALHTFIFDLFPQSPYLWFKSPTKQCGKTRAPIIENMPIKNLSEGADPAAGLNSLKVRAESIENLFLSVSRRKKELAGSSLAFRALRPRRFLFKAKALSRRGGKV